MAYEAHITRATTACLVGVVVLAVCCHHLSLVDLTHFAGWLTAWPILVAAGTCRASLVPVAAHRLRLRPRQAIAKEKPEAPTCGVASRRTRERPHQVSPAEAAAFACSFQEGVTGKLVAAYDVSAKLKPFPCVHYGRLFLTRRELAFEGKMGMTRILVPLGQVSGTTDPSRAGITLSFGTRQSLWVGQVFYMTAMVLLFSQP